MNIDKNKFTFDLQRFDSAFSGGDGSQDNPYQIKTVADLKQLSTDVKNGNSYEDKCFKLMANLDLSGVANWTPIGNYDNRFRGTFDGDGHTINNLTVTGGDNVGLFGYIRDGTIKNVSLVNANISGNDCIGGIVGCNYGTIDNCTVEGTISGQQYVGGIVGLNPGRIKNSFTNAQVSGNSYFGAVVGLKSERLEDSVKYVQDSGGYWVAQLVGIIVGDFSGNYYVQGSDNCASKIGILNLPEGVTATFNSGGGDDVTFVGKKYYLQGSNLLLSVDKTTAGYHDVKGLRIGDTDLTADANGRYALVFDGQNTNVTINGNPIIDGLTYSNGVYLIQSYTDLGILSRYVAAGHNCAGLKFKVTDEGTSNTHYDIQNSQYQIGTEETPFAGTFDGNGKTIELLDLTIDALFGYIDGATIKNLKVTSFRESGNDKVSYSKGIAANASGTNTISDCVVSSTNIESGGFVYNNSGTLTIRNSVFNGSIYSGDGFVGSNTGTLRVRGSMFAPSSVPENYNGNAFAGGTVNIANSCYTAGTGNGATKAFKFTLPANTNLANDNSLLTFDGEQYIAQGTDLKLTVDAAQFTQFASFKVDGNDVAGKNGVYTVTIGETYPTITAAGRVKIADLLYDSADDCYLIESAEELQALADFISAGNTLTNSFKLTHDIDISGKNIQLGTSANPFAGTFNGNGYTITTDRALFDYVNGATINNLMITGTLNSGNGFVNNVSGTVNIQNSIFAPEGDFSGNAFANGGTITNSYYTKGTAGDGATKVHTLSGLPRQLSLICADADKFTFGDTTYYKSGAELTFTRDGEERRIVDGVTVGGVAATKVGDAYKVTLGNDATDFAVEGSWHIQLNGAGDTYTNRDDNISILGGAGNDSVDNYGKNVTITAGEGNDTIKLRNGNNSVKLDGFGVGDVIEFDGTIDSLGSEGYNEQDKKAVIISNHVWTTLDGVKFSEDGLVWSFDAANRKAQYGIQKLEGVYLDENNKIQYRMNEIKPENMYVELSGIGADFAIQTDNLDGFGGLQAGTETIVLNGEHFKGGDGITVTSNERGYAFALIDSVSGVHFTGSDKGEYIYVDKSDVTLTGGGGADTIKLGLNVEKITVTDMGTDDRIYFPGTINKENIEIVDGSLVAHWYGGYVSDRAVTIGGINDSIATNLSGWRDTENGKAYYIGNANGFGADEHGMYIGYVEANDLTPIIEFSGLNIVGENSPRYDNGYGYPQVSIGAENFAGNELKILQEQAGTVVETSYDDFTGKTLVGSNANYIKHDEYAGDSQIGDIIQNHGSNLVIMCGGGDDSIDNYASDVTIDGGSGNNNINLQSGGNISVSGGTGDNQIYISTNEAVTINTAQGNNTIHGTFDSLTVENFNAGDVIYSGYDYEYKYNITSISTVEGGKLVATYDDDSTITIAGISQIASDDVTNTWSNDANSWTFSQSVGTEGAYIIDGNIAYAENKTFFTIGGLKDGLTAEQIAAGVDIAGSKVTLSESVLDTSKSPSISDDYHIQIESSALQREVTTGWNKVGEDTYAYFNEAGTGSGWTQTDGSWHYTQGIKPQVILGDVNTSTVVDDKWVPVITFDETNKLITLDDSDFLSEKTNINVLSNAGGYDFTISDGKSLNGFSKIGAMKFGADTAGKAYYLVSTVEDLQAFRDYVNAGNTCEGYTFKQTADLDLSAIENFTPIGTNDAPFKGTFNGNDHTISNLTIENTGNGQAGLFYELLGGTVQNVRLINADIKTNNYAGGIVGYNEEGTVKNCFVDGSISGNSKVGAIVGNNYRGKYSNNFYHSDAGGLGTPVYKLDLSEGVTANHVSGVTKTFDGTTYYGSGATLDLTLDSDTANDYEKITVKNGTQIGDNTYRYTVYNKDSAQVEFTFYPKIEGLTFTANNNGGSYNLDDAASFASLSTFLANYAGDTSALKFNLTADAYEISDAEQLKLFATIVNNGNTCRGKTFKLADDIDLSSIANWTPIGNYAIIFGGTFDGDGHTINNLKITGGNKVGLFGYSSGTSTIKNVSLVNANISGNNQVGGIVGMNYGTIDNCAVDGTISGDWDVGGIVSCNYGTIQNCLTLAKTSGNFSGGAIVGNNYNGSITNSYRAGDATPAYSTPLAYELTLHEGVTIAEDKGVKYNGKLYAPAGDLKLIIGATAHDANFEKITGIVGATDNEDGTFTYTMPESNSAPQFSGLPVIAGLTFDATDDSYIIDSVDALQTLRNYVNDEHDCAGLAFKQTEEINLDRIANWTPIDNADNSFAGTFDGGGNTINNLTTSP